MLQVALMPAGCQPWSRHVLAANGGRFAYCSTLACYVYELVPRAGALEGDSATEKSGSVARFRLKRIFPQHDRTITSVGWNPHNENVIACTDMDHTLFIHDIESGTSTTITFYGRIKLLAWIPSEPNTITVVEDDTHIRVVDVANKEKGNLHNFTDTICLTKWSPALKGTLFVGDFHGGCHLLIVSGSLWQKLSCVYQRIEIPQTVHQRSSVLDAQWDPLSESYVLVGFKNEFIALYDVVNKTTIKTFAVGHGGFKAIAWVRSMPGNFISTDTRSGMVRMWNVSQDSPIEYIRVKEGAFQNLAMLDAHVQLRSKAVCTFFDGGIGVFDLVKRKWDFLREKGHIETIFACEFRNEPIKVESSNATSKIAADKVLATCSFDGSLKLWKAGNHLSFVDSMPGEDEGILYSISWSPGASMVAAATAKGSVVIWDVERRTIAHRHHLHRGAVYHVSWAKTGQGLLASGSADGNCCVFQVDGVVKKKLRHPNEVAGCDWNPHHPQYLATGCMDGKVRIWDITQDGSKPALELSGSP